jgi:prefoldin subunit 5
MPAAVLCQSADTIPTKSPKYTTMSADSDEIGNKVEEYSKFIVYKLRPELDRAEQTRRDTANEIAGYKDLREQLERFGETKMMEYESMVDLGYHTISCRAVGDLTKIHVHVGMGFHVEMTIPEAFKFVNKRLLFLENDVLKQKDRKVREMTDHIMVASSILDELTRDMERDR